MSGLLAIGPAQIKAVKSVFAIAHMAPTEQIQVWKMAKEQRGRRPDSPVVVQATVAGIVATLVLHKNVVKERGNTIHDSSA
jgi:hypothetical protein